MSIDLDVLLERLYSEKARLEVVLAMVEQDIERVGAMRDEAHVYLERYAALESSNAAPSSVSLQVPLVPAALTPTKRAIPKLSSAVERFSDEQINEFIQAVRGKQKQMEAVDYIGERVPDFQHADAVKIIIGADLTTGGNRSNVSSHVYRQIINSKRYELIGPGRFRLVGRTAQGKNTSDAATREDQSGDTTYPPTSPSPLGESHR